MGPATSRTRPVAARARLIAVPRARMLSSSVMPWPSSIYLIAGEASGDAIGARLMRALSARASERARPLHFRGIGGSQMTHTQVPACDKLEGSPNFTSLFPMAELSVMGLVELIPRLPALRARLHQTVDDIVATRPTCVVCIDSKGFSRRVMTAVRSRLGTSTPPLVQYVAPSVWAYRDSQRSALAFRGVADHLLLLLPFESAHWKAAGVPHTYVGHPAVEAHFEMPPTAAVAKTAPVLGLMAGSRPAEVDTAMRILPAAVRDLQHRSEQHSRIQPLFINAPETDERVRGMLKASGLSARVLLNDSPAALSGALAQCDVVASVSGTAVLQLALAKVPTVCFYRASLLTELAARLLARVRHVSIPNLLVELEPQFAAERERLPLIPELLFSRCTPRALADMLEPLLVGPGAREVRAAQVAALAPVCESLTAPHVLHRPSALAADVVWRLANLDGAGRYVDGR